MIGSLIPVAISVLARPSAATKVVRTLRGRNEERPRPSALRLRPEESARTTIRSPHHAEKVTAKDSYLPHCHIFAQG